MHIIRYIIAIKVKLEIIENYYNVMFIEHIIYHKELIPMIIKAEYSHPRKKGSLMNNGMHKLFDP